MEAAVRFELTPIKARGFADRGLKPLDYDEKKKKIGDILKNVP